MLKKFFVLIILPILVLSISACKPDRPDGCPKLYPCTLQIIQGGAPLENATVSLFPEDPSLAKWAVNSMSDAEGKVVLMTQTFPGVPLGKYKVTVSKAQIASVNGLPDKVEFVSEEFTDKETTPALVEVVKGMTEPVTIDVGDPQ